MAKFRAKARAVELLGKGQIADLPTAITELWKNGYDAYAKNLVCRLFLETYKDNESPIFLISDDGFGMSETDIVEKWFVLGTDSKARGEKIEPHFGLNRRTPMGEKGIGRLSVSYLGNQLLMLSKKQGEVANALYIDWRVLDNYDFYLDDLNIPLFTFSSNDEFKKNEKGAVAEFLKNLDEKRWMEQKWLRKEMLEDWNSFKIPDFLYQEVIQEFTKKDYHGTTFLIFTPHDQLVELSNKDRIDLKKDSALTYLRASLSGMHNDLKNSKKDFETHFFLHDASGKYDLIDEFFTQEEMRNADHWLKGEFDENGFFTGEIRVFNRREKYTFKPNRPPGKTSYGPFSIEWGSLEGEQKSSLLNQEQFRTLNNKLETFGGLYVYRDGFRVLPYGRTEYDFLDFEKRRNLGAGYYFFAHRRFVGYINLKREKNPNLKDKAGREGFIQNKAYREFRDDLIELFIDISKRYMRKLPDGEQPSFRQEQIEEIQKKYDRQHAAAKKKNAKTKKAFLEQLKENKPVIVKLENEIGDLANKLSEEAKKLEINYNNYNKLVAELEDKRAQVRGLRLTKPQAVKITKSQEREYIEFQKEYTFVDDRLKTCIRLVEDTRSRINAENLKLEYNEKFRSHIKYIEKLFSDYRAICTNSFNRVNNLLSDELNTQVDHFIDQTEKIKILADDNTESISSKINMLDLISEDQKTQIEHSIGGFINHVSNLQIDVDDDFLRAWYEKQNQNLKEKLSDYEELAQLGMSIEIIDHQFNVMYSQMNDAVHEIDQYSRKNKGIESAFKQLKAAFQHLEGNYKLLKPLYRTSRRTREVITGRQIESYIKDFFKNDFNRYRIDFSVSDAFREYEFFTYDSIIKPIFLNIINNANYWLIPVENRTIRIDLVDDEIRIMNSGERIDDSYLDDIFTLFFSRKRDGRGIGLYLAKKNLQSIGYDIFATNKEDVNKLKGACFIIKKEGSK
ncbi:ATP-binding protein [Flagellimonas okinawensis]|uniref:ATP-binding protein n=1 Tax=Flagellimonas okinawensis TaxID=3031324 RepID=A0ABT5XM57_9FLAO|nr:ATP-binding protein [[Muricauda] okinawensis]MDF0706967.1 ATP-binding protein [[Muricauda] okinawensis]